MENGSAVPGRKVLPGGKEAPTDDEVDPVLLRIEILFRALGRGCLRRCIFDLLVLDLGKGSAPATPLPTITDLLDDVLDRFNRLERHGDRTHPKIAFSA